MRFSFIIPTLNESHFIQACLVDLQTLKDACEIIIVDGGSNDNTLIIAKPLADKIIKSTPGRARQMNVGAKQAKGETLVFLHADTFLPENALDLITKALTKTNNGWGRFNIQLKGKHPMLKVIAVFMNFRSCLTGIATGDQVIFVSKQLFDKVGGYPDIALMEDISFCAKLKNFSDFTCIKAKVTSSGRRWEKNGIFKTILLMWRLRLGHFFGENPDTLSTLYSRGIFWKP